jgi:hypothetical protein
VLLLPISCNYKSKKSDFELKIDLLKQTIPTVKEEQTYSFKDLSRNVWEWYKSEKLIEIDSAFREDYVNKPKPIMYYGEKYQRNYCYNFFDSQEDCFNLIIVQYVNANESSMYLLQFDKQGERKKIFVLASISKSPDDYEEVYSLIQGNAITTYRYFNDEGFVKRDTTKIIW